MDPYEHRSEDGFLRRGGRKKRKRKPRPLWKRVGGKTNSRGNRAPLSIDLEQRNGGFSTFFISSLSPPYFSLIFQTRSKLLSRFPKLSKFLYFPSPLHFLPSSLSPSSPSPPLQRLFSPSRYDDAKIALRLWIAENAIRDWREGRRRRREGWNLKFKEMGNRRLLK